MFTQRLADSIAEGSKFNKCSFEGRLLINVSPGKQSVVTDFSCHPLIGHSNCQLRSELEVNTYNLMHLNAASLPLTLPFSFIMQFVVLYC